MTEVFAITVRLVTPFAFDFIPPWSPPIVELLMRQLSGVLLAAGCLRYLLDRIQPARAYAVASTAAIIATGAAAGLYQWSLSPRGEPPFEVPQALVAQAGVAFMGFACMSAALVLIYRRVQGSGRGLLFAAVAALSAAQLSTLVGDLGAFRPSPRPAYPLLMASWALGLLLITYLFIRVRTEEVHSDMNLLEGRVRARTQELESALEQLAGANALLEQQSNVDALTGAGNRRSFNDALAAEWARARRTGKPITVAMVDLDRFKEINDIHGHPVGDQCLVGLAGVLQNVARRSADLVARLGGDEFAVLLPETSGEAAAQSLDDVRLQASMLTSPQAPEMAVTISVGVASCVPSPESSPDELVQQADNALYKAKRSGRNRVAVAESGTLQVL